MNGDKTNTSDGSGVVYRDSKFGLLTSSVVSAVGLAVVEWLGSLDFSDAPSVIATLAPPAVGLAVGWITARVTKRYPRR